MTEGGGVVNYLYVTLGLTVGWISIGFRYTSLAFSEREGVSSITCVFPLD